jgi:hypothetical protein
MLPFAPATFSTITGWPSDAPHTLGHYSCNSVRRTARSERQSGPMALCTGVGRVFSWAQAPLPALGAASQSAGIEQ